jgi:hypothetical protein
LSFQRAPVAKWLTRGSAKPVFAGSIPARRSKFQSKDHFRIIENVESRNRITQRIQFDVYAALSP